MLPDRRITAFVCASLLFASVAVADNRPPFVPPVDELEILDPQVDSTGKPRAIPEDGHIEIPPTLIVHRYYFTGDRQFQGPMFVGGPCVVVVHHPCTGELLYLPVQMLPGAPRICYTRNAITYDFGREEVKICFKPVLLGHVPVPVVSYRRSPKNKPPKLAKGHAPPGPLGQGIQGAFQTAGGAVISTVKAIPLGTPAISAIEERMKTAKSRRKGTSITEGLGGTTATVR